jgi:REP element-mobilizing transposase RayT
MAFNRDRHHRRSIRLHGYDYSQAGSYFITICAHERQPLFGDIVNGVMALNAAGMAVDAVWQALPMHYPSIVLGEYVVMPNHFHGIVETVGAQLIAPHNAATDEGAINRAPTVGHIIRGFKARCTHEIRQINSTSDQPIWQRNYYEHIIRTEQAYQNISEYIRSNPQRWHEDGYYI